MRITGHLFVAHGRMEKIRSDAVIVPTDRAFDVTRYWRPFFVGGTPRRPAVWPQPFAQEHPSSKVWFIKVFDHGPLRGDELRQSIDGIIADIASSGFTRNDRKVPVVAVPVLGIGGGGQGGERGRVVRELVEALQDAVRAHAIDVVLVSGNPSVFGAVQHFRRELDACSCELGEQGLATARELGELAQQGHLALFLGAGVSMAAGLPSWGSLLTSLATEAEIDDETLKSLGDNPLDQADLIAQALGKRLGTEVAERTGGPRPVSLAHALLAGMNCAEAVTTNYDVLYEEAVHATRGVRPSVVPWEPVQPERPWLLKMHGDVGRHDSIVLTRRSFVRYDATFRLAGSLLQALMMTRHLSVVGTSMTDDNVIRLAIEVDEFVSGDKRFGTFVDVSGASARVKLWDSRFRWHSCAGDDTAERVRQMEIFLDAVGMYAADDASWLLDERFAGLLRNDGERDCIDTARNVYRGMIKTCGSGRACLPVNMILVVT